MTMETPAGVKADEASRRRKSARWRLWVGIPLVVILGFRIKQLVGVDAEAWLWSLGLLVPITLISCLWVYLGYRRKMRRVAVLVGRGGWTGLCADPDYPRQWQAIIIDAAGVRTFDPSGDVARQWKWNGIRGVTVERLPVELISLSGVVLHLVDGSRAELLLPGPMGPYTARRAKVAANEIRGHLSHVHVQVLGDDL